MTAELKEKHAVTPGLAVVLVGEDPASQVYLGSKVKNCGELKIKSFEYKKPVDWSEQEILKLIDMGVNRIENPDPNAEKKTRLVADVHFVSAKQVAGKITPVAGGVGPMTITMLMKNTIRAAKLHHNVK